MYKATGDLNQNIFQIMEGIFRLSGVHMTFDDIINKHLHIHNIEDSVMLKKLNQAMEYIENNLTDDLSSKEIAQYIGVSEFFFRNIFMALTGISPSEYIKERRLSEANKELLNGEQVTYVAFKYGYRSIEGFTRAFKNWSGVLPSEAAKNSNLQVTPKISFIVTVEGGDNIKCRIIERPALNFVGLSKYLPIPKKGVSADALDFTNSVTDIIKEELLSLQNTEPFGILYGKIVDDESEDSGAIVRQFYGILMTSEYCGDRYEKFSIPPCSWAVFPSEGVFPEVYLDSCKKIYAEWFFNSGYEQAHQFVVATIKTNNRDEDSAYAELWVPVKLV